VSFIEDFQVVRTRPKGSAASLERDAVLLLVRPILGRIPRNPHFNILSH
jgi:hypothetical protein